MKSALLGLIGGLLLAVSAIAADAPPANWFVALDSDRDGGVSLNELQAMRYERFLLIDANQDNELSAQEVSGHKGWPERFRRMDANTDGRVTRAEFEQTGRSRFAIIDIDGNGRITPHEALNFQRKVRKYGPQTAEKTG